MNGTLAQALMQWGSDLLISLLSVACGYAVLFLRRNAARLAAETTQIQDQTVATSLKGAIAQVDDLAERTVNMLEQTTADEVRQAVKDGKVDRKELLALGPKAANQVMSLIGPGLMDILEQHIGDVGTFILNTVENKVRDLKVYGQPTSPATQPVNIVVNATALPPAANTTVPIPSDNGAVPITSAVSPTPASADSSADAQTTPKAAPAEANTLATTEGDVNDVTTN